MGLSTLFSLLQLGKYWWVLPFVIAQAGTIPVTSYIFGRLATSLNNTDVFITNIIYASIVLFGSIAANLIGGFIIQFGAEYRVSMLRKKIMKELLKKSSDFFESRNTGSLNATILSDTNMMLAACSNILPEIIRAFFVFAWSCVFVALVKWYFFAILFGEAIIVCLISVFLGKRVSKFNRRKLGFDKGFAATQSEVVSHWKTIKIFNIKEYFLNKSDNALRKSRKADRVIVTSSQLGASFYSLLTSGVAILYALWGQSLYLQGEITIGDLTVLWSSATTVQFSIRTFAGKLTDLMAVSAAADSIVATMDFSEQNETEEGTEISGSSWGLKLSNLVFKHQSLGVPTLKGLDMEIHPNSMTAIVGPSGAGKSTTINLILKMVSSYEGDILVNDTNLRDVSNTCYYNGIGYVPQDLSIFDGTIEDNIRFGKIDCSMEDIEEACEQANIHNFVLSLPEGYKTIVGERGFRLSGGQKQRIAVARALVKKPKLLIFDEATSSLDTTSERKIQESVERLSKSITTIVVAHRLSTIKKADKIYVLNEGLVVEHGSWDQLVKMDGVFASLVQAQNAVKQATLNFANRQRSSTVC